MSAWQYFLNVSEDFGILSLMFFKLVLLKKTRVNHMVTSVAANTFVMLQLALALLVNGKRVIETLHEF